MRALVCPVPFPLVKLEITPINLVFSYKVSIMIFLMAGKDEELSFGMSVHALLQNNRFQNLNQLIIYRSLHILKFLEEFFIFNIIKPDFSTGTNNRYLTFNTFSHLIIAIVSLSLFFFFWSGLLRYNLHTVKFTLFSVCLWILINSFNDGATIVISPIKLSPNSLLSQPWPLATNDLFSVPQILSFPEYYINGIIQQTEF